MHVEIGVGILGDFVGNGGGLRGIIGGMRLGFGRKYNRRSFALMTWKLTCCVESDGYAL